MKFVHLVEGHNFHVDWHFKFGVDRHENLAPRSASPVHEHMLPFKVGNYFLQISVEKNPIQPF
jgi:hypothetical protein